MTVDLLICKNLSFLRICNQLQDGVPVEMNTQQRIAVGITDIAILAELCFSMFFANKDLENFSSVFFRYFFSMLVPTLIIAWFSIKRLGSTELQPEK
ncbi:MAG: hypothetical protein AB9866_14300 [Syntrophobacteraceae bacterium]